VGGNRRRQQDKTRDTGTKRCMPCAVHFAPEDSTPSTRIRLPVDALWRIAIATR
jgi:hypothetical protein